MHINKVLLWISKLYPLIVILFMFLPIQKSIAAYTIGPDDVLRISVYGYGDLRTETRVSADGKITFPLIGELMASGKTSMELEEAIAVRLVNGGFIRDAQVSVSVMEHISQQVPVLGYVNRPGRYSLGSDSSLVDLIAMAEGIHELGDDKVVVTRIIDGKIQRQKLNLRDYLENSEKNIMPFKMRQGDVVYVPKAPIFYIYGEVQHPGEYRLEPEMSVIKALSIAGGLTLRGSENDIVIKRKDEGDVLQEIDAQLNDGVLKADVIYVGERWF